MAAHHIQHLQLLLHLSLDINAHS